MSADFCSFCDTLCHCGPDGKDKVIMLDDLYIVCSTCLDRTDLVEKDGKPVTIRSLVSNTMSIVPVVNCDPSYEHCLACIYNGCDHSVSKKQLRVA